MEEVYRIRHHGDCLSPLGITDTTQLIGIRLTDWKTDDCCLLKYIDKVIAVKLSGRNVGLMKILANYDIMNRKLYLKQLNPLRVMCFSLDEIEDILLLQKEDETY